MLRRLQPTWFENWPPAAREALLSAAGLVLFLEVIKDSARFIPLLATGLYTLAAAVQLYYPLWRVGKDGHDGRAVGLDESHWRQDLKWAAVLCALTFVPFAFGHHWFWTQYMHRTFVLRAPEHVLSNVATQLFAVALPEETFYRGFIQPRLATAYRQRWRVLGADIGWEIPVTSAFFALGHVAGEYDPLRLGPFFPGLLFGWLRARTGSVYGAVLYHGCSNIFSEILFTCYR